MLLAVELFDGMHPIAMYIVCNSATDQNNMLFSVQFDLDIESKKAGNWGRNVV